MQSAIAKAKQALNLSDNGDGITADELESAADWLRKNMDSLASVGLAKSHPLVAEATKVYKSLHDRLTKTTVSAVDVVSVFECMCQVAGLVVSH